MKQFSVFWGCTIPARFPSIEKSVRVVLAHTGADPLPVAGYTCCPESTLVKALDGDAHLAASARNLAVAAEAGLPIVTPCSGCYSTLKSAQAALALDWRVRNRLNGALSRAGLSLDGLTPVWHLAEWLYEEIGPAGLAKRVVQPLSGMRMAVHYGCHLLRPSPAVRWDSPAEPTKLEELLTALGAHVVEYGTRLDCCGGALDRVGERKGSLALCASKLDDATSSGAEALVVACPSCFQQFDLNQAALRRGTEVPQLPVFYLTELIALALGYGAEELGLGQHRIEVSGFLEAWQRRLAARRQISTHFSVSELATCAGCRACEQDCPVAKSDSSFVPTAIIAELLAGGLESVLRRPDVWKCLECYACYERCHSRLGMAEVFALLKRLAAERGFAPAQVRAALETFERTGRLGEPREAQRRKLGLEPLPAGGGEDLADLLSRLRAGDPGAPAGDTEPAEMCEA